MYDAESAFDQEIDKLKALNNICLSIWTRVSETSIFSHNLKSISFSKNTLRFRYEKTEGNLSLSSYFSEAPNFFNDVLPNEVYFDLASIIEKYTLLNPKRTLPILQKWKAALENVHVYLGGIEKTIADPVYLNILEYFHIDFQVDTLIQRVVYTPRLKHATSVSLNFSISDITDNKLDEVKQLADTVLGLYEMGDVHSMNEYYENDLPEWISGLQMDVDEDESKVVYSNYNSEWKPVIAKPLNVVPGQESYRWCVQVTNVGAGNLGMIGAVPGGSAPQTGTHFSSMGGGIYQPSNSQIYARWSNSQKSNKAVNVNSKVLFDWKIIERKLNVYVDGTLVAEFTNTEEAIIPCIFFYGGGSSAKFVPVDEFENLDNE